MKNLFIILVFTLFICPAFGQSVGYITSVKEINTYATTDDFSNTFEINFVSEKSKNNKKKDKNKSYFDSVKCQAVRLSKSWFITAAHCVENVCEEGCDFQTRLVVGRNYEMDIISQSSPKRPQVFIHPNREIQTKNVSTNDIALIYFKPSNSKYVYKDPQSLHGITQNEFINRLKNYRTYKRALSSYNTPTLLIMGKYRQQGPVLARKFSVLSSFQDERKVLRSNNKAIYYPQNKTFILENFGIKQGISGSGLMTSKGELAGITSAISDTNNGNQLAQFAAFDKQTLKFIQEHVGDIEYTILK